MSLRLMGICSGPVETNGYLLIDEVSKQAVIVDAPMDSASWFTRIIQEQQLSVRELWLTHSHWDHTADAATLQRDLNLRILVHEHDAYRLPHPNEHTVFELPMQLEAVEEWQTIAHGDILRFGAQSWEVLFTPGHTEGGVCFVNHDDGILVSGDTLFAGSIGRTDLPGGDMDQLLASIFRELMCLDDNIRVYPGHMESTTIGRERQSNPFLQERD